MSLVPFAGSDQSRDFMRQMAMSRLMRNQSDDAEQMSYVGMIAGGAVENLRDADVRGSDSLARQLKAISEMSVGDSIKGELQAQAVANNQAWSGLLQQAGTNIAGLVR